MKTERPIAGQHYVVTWGHPIVETGSIVELVEDDGSTCPFFKLVEGTIHLPCVAIRLDKLEEVAETTEDSDEVTEESTEEAGFTLEDGALGGQHLRYNGVLVGVLYDDGTMHIWSRDIPDFKDLGPKAAEEPEEDVVTRENLQRGVVYKLRKGAGHHRLTSDSRVVLDLDDGTDDPFFEPADGSGRWSCVSLEILTPA